VENVKKIQKIVSDNRGLTLVELLAVIVLLSIILIIVSSIHLMGVKEYNVQSQVIKNQDNVRLAMSMLTKDVRSASTVSVTNNQLTLATDSGTTIYSQGQSALNKNGNPVVKGISQFIVVQNGNKVTLTLVSSQDPEGKSVTLSTDMYIRQ
jgi:prepilin-type N-terminal cleavage/methylation domain-containing protein